MSTKDVKDGSQEFGEAVLHLDPRPDAPAQARDFLAEFARLHDGVAEACLPDGTLVISELVANAVWHAATPLSVHLTVTVEHLEVAVQDRGPGQPRVLPADRRRIGGVGLALVQRVSDSWGVEGLRQGGKRVWCRLKPALRSRPAPAG